MTITTLAQINAGQQFPRDFNKLAASGTNGGFPSTLWALAGSPAAGGYDTTLNGVVLDSTSAQVTGQIPFYTPGSGSVYLSRLSFNILIGTATSLVLCDRLWHNGGYDATLITAQNSTTPTWPARDISGSTNGDGVLLGVECSTAMGAATPVITVSYTNSAGTAGRTGTNINATASAAPIGAFYKIGLQAGDTGVRSVQSLTLDTSWISGTMNLVAYRSIARVEQKGLGTGIAVTDAITLGMPLLYTGSVPYIYSESMSGNNASYSGLVQFTVG